MHPLTIIFGFILAISALALTTAIIMQRRHIAYKERKEALDREAKFGAGSAGAEKFAKLEERVQVLERIATDKDVDLARQIEALRDMQEIEQLTAPKEAAR